MAECKGVEVGLELEFLEESRVGQALEVCQVAVSKQQLSWHMDCLSGVVLFLDIIGSFQLASRLLRLLSSMFGKGSLPSSMRSQGRVKCMTHHFFL